MSDYINGNKDYKEATAAKTISELEQIRKYLRNLLCEVKLVNANMSAVVPHVIELLESKGVE